MPNIFYQTNFYDKIFDIFVKRKTSGIKVVSLSQIIMIYIVLPRKEVSKTVKSIQKLCNKQVFFVTSEVSKYTGGYGVIK